MTSYAGFPGHDEIRAFMEAQQTDVSLSSSTSSPSSATTPNTSSSSADMVPCAPPCSLSGSSENLTPNTDTTSRWAFEAFRYRGRHFIFWLVFSDFIFSTRILVGQSHSPKKSFSNSRYVSIKCLPLSVSFDYLHKSWAEKAKPNLKYLSWYN